MSGPKANGVSRAFLWFCLLPLPTRLLVDELVSRTSALYLNSHRAL